MRIRKVTLSNVRAFDNASLTWPGAAPGWYVVLGDNSTGKSTLIRAIALALTGPSDAIALRQVWNDWLRHGASNLEVRVEVEFDAEFDVWSGQGRYPASHFAIGFAYARDEVHPTQASTTSHGKRSVWANKPGWFSAAFGPFRRFTGGNRDYDKLFLSNPQLARHLTAFGEDVALTECLDWLARLHRSDDAHEQQLATQLKTFINDCGFLPHAVKLEGIEDEQPVFADAAGVKLPVDQLSDGYRSTLSMAFELIRQLRQVYPGRAIFTDTEAGLRVMLPGVVLIDEADVHLHPSWQARIGEWFRTFFPEMQFIVTTHSPLVCRPASGVWRLESTDGAIGVRPIEGIALERLRLGTVDEALDSPAFDLGELGRSQRGNEKLVELATLNRKARRGKLTSNESKERERLRAIFPVHD